MLNGVWPYCKLNTVKTTAQKADRRDLPFAFNRMWLFLLPGYGGISHLLFFYWHIFAFHSQHHPHWLFYFNEKMGGEDIMSIVILTDGYADFPDERETHGIPVLWIITNECITPPWGKSARVKAEE